MNSDGGISPVSASRLLLIAAVAAFTWLLISVFGSGSSAVASEGRSPDSLLATLTDIVPEPVAQAVEPTLLASVATVDAVAAPVLEPLVTETLTVVDKVTAVAAAPLPVPLPLRLPLGQTFGGIDTMNSAPAATSAADATRPEPAAVSMTAAADTRAAQVPAAGSPNIPLSLEPPPGPVSTGAAASGSAGGGHMLLASLTGLDERGLHELASAAPRNDALPSSVTLGGDSSPD